MKKISFSLTLLCFLFIYLPLAQAHQAHNHSAAKVNIFVDGPLVNISLESPLDNLLPFDYSPTTIREQTLVKEMAYQMHKAEDLFQLTPAAECRLENVALFSDKLEASLLLPNDSPDPPQIDCAKELNCRSQFPSEEHGDLKADFVFICSKPQNLKSIDILLFTAWPKFTRIQTHAITPKGQRAATLTPPKNKLSW